jgi:hypothetical protein
MPWSFIIPAAASLIGGMMSSDASQNAASQASNASNQATGAQQAMFNTINQQQAPWRQAGETALGQIGQMQPQFTHQFNAQDLNANMAPNYQFQLEQGQGAIQNAANRQTGLVSGNAMKGLQDYTQNFAGNAYQNAFSNYSANQTNIFNRLSNIAGLGQTANANVGSAGSDISRGIAGSMIGAGQAQAAGTVGSANALSGGLNNAAGWYTVSQLMNNGGYNQGDYMNYLNRSG